ncbi:MAG: CAP domain-containing protein [Candidatus Dojkabacteria bacterium]|nr:CAP domain-containing protein [Candidatus Dojkabacteria bacterium]
MRKLFIPSKENSYKPILLRKVALVTYTIILAFVNTFGGFLGIPQAMASSITPSNIIMLTNQERAAVGLNTLNTNAKLSAAATAKANNMFEEQYWDHYGPNGETPWMFITQAGYTYVYAGENLAKGFRTAEGVHEAWMASPTHKENIMSGKYKEIGVAVVEGTLLGKETILVVQMFGNPTTQTFSPTSTVKSDTDTVTKPTVPIVKESGEIKSISITNPKMGEVIDDANIDIKGETVNVSGEYTVEILNSDTLVGETESSSSVWEFDKVSDWEEGEQNIQAQIKGENIKSDVVKFTIDSTPPEIEQSTITVKRDTELFELQFSYSPDTTELKFVTGDKTFDLELTQENIATLSIPKEDIGDRSVLMATDQVGNISEIDISEYFLEGEEDSTDFGTNLVLWLRNVIGTTDGISLIIVGFIFILLSIEIYVYWRKGRLGKSAGELFTVGAWWLIILVGAFKGFGGLV